LHAAGPRAVFVGNNLTDVGKIIPLSGNAVARLALKANARRQAEIATGQRNKIFRERCRPAGDNIENIVR
jgi:hypothetical protein